MCMLGGGGGRGKVGGVLSLLLPGSLKREGREGGWVGMG